MNLSLVDGIHQVVDLGVASQNDADRLRLKEQRFAEDIDSRRFRHSLVGDDDIHILFPQKLNGILSGQCLENAEVSKKGASELVKI